MAHVLRPLIRWPWRRRPHSAFSHLISLGPSSTRAATILPIFTPFSNSHREVHFRSRALRPRNLPSLSDVDESDDESSDGSGERKSRNERKREARRAVRWGMELARFSSPQIKRILRVAELEQEVFDAIVLAKRLGHDVREGKRRQYNYIGRLLREVEPELMDDLIQATKDGDHSKFQDLLGTEVSVSNNDDEDEEEEYTDDDEEEDSIDIDVVTRWYDGLINKDIGITNEIYALREVEFDRQELRQLVRKVQSAAEREAGSDENGKPDAAAAAATARKSLTRFLRGLVKQLPAE